MLEARFEIRRCVSVSFPCRAGFNEVLSAADLQR